MGRITVFTCEDLNSKRATMALGERKVPYAEISLAKYPSRRADLRALANGSDAVPQVFFNARRVGGVDESLRELQRWDNRQQFSSPLAMHDAAIGSQPDPTDPLLNIPEEELYANKASAGAKAKAKLREPSGCVKLLDGTVTTYWDIADKLRNTLPQADVVYQGTTYRNCFMGTVATDEFEEAVNVTRAKALEFGTTLLQAGVVQCINNPDSDEFKGDEESIYRLQCQATPDVLNSYRIWPMKEDDSSSSSSSSSKNNKRYTNGNGNGNGKSPTRNMQEEVPVSVSPPPPPLPPPLPLEVVDSLDAMLRSVELDAYAARSGTVSHAKSVLDPRWPMFEEAVCELQVVDMGSLTDDERMAFGLNAYKLLLRYALIKIGVCRSEPDLVHFLRNVRFDVGHQLYSFQEWLNGILRANTKVTYSSGAPFNRMDKRRKLSLPALDARVHFAVSADPAFGSRSSLPFARFTPDDIEDELAAAARVFCADDANVSVDLGANEVRLSKIFAWYRSDFGFRRGEMLTRIADRYLADGSRKQSELRKVLARGGDLQVKYVDVDWTRNVSNYVEYDRRVLVGDVNKTFGSMLRRFKPPEPTPNESMRLSILHGLNMLDSLPEERFDRITRMVKDEFDVPLCVVSLIDTERQWFKSCQWGEECPVPAASETGRNISFCGHAIHFTTNEVMCVPDTLEDDRFADNPVVTGPLGVRFYAGAPLAVPSRDDAARLVSIGTLCIIDVRPRELSSGDIDKLCRYASEVKKEILRRDCEESDDGFSLYSN